MNKKNLKTILKQPEMIDAQFESYTVIVADGSFPRNDIPLGYIKNAERIICCDGGAENLIRAGFIPDAIVGDMDSLNESIAGRFHDRIFRDMDQDTNDLTKTVVWCLERGYKDLLILGATGKREDHTIGNISLLAEYIKDVNVKMVTDTGMLMALKESSVVTSFPGQQVSIFSIDPQTEISSHGLRYPLDKKKITNWWVATLNESNGERFSLDFTGGPVIIYLNFR